MTSYPLLQVSLRTERDVVQARQRAREVAAALGLDNQDQIRIATATSEIARNAFRYARNGKVAFSVAVEPPQSLEVTVTDSGPGIANLEEILEGRYKSETGLGMGIIGTKRLMDEFDIETTPKGTTIRMAKRIPVEQTWTSRAVVELSEEMQNRTPEGPYEEIEQQNQELLKTLQELRARQEELELLNRELEDTNRGVVALYAELDERADYLRRASELKTKFLSNVSHEFRTPLNSIISLARLLMSGMDGESGDGTVEAGTLHRVVGARPAGDGERPARSGQGGSRQDAHSHQAVRSAGAVQRTEGHVETAAGRQYLCRTGL